MRQEPDLVCLQEVRPTTRARRGYASLGLERWDSAERSVIEGLGEWDLADCFRALHGYERQDVSWVFHTRARRKAGFRLDHVLASASLGVIWCDYQSDWREQGLSDHSAIEALFEPNGAQGSKI